MAIHSPPCICMYYPEQYLVLEVYDNNTQTVLSCMDTTALKIKLQMCMYKLIKTV